MSNKLSQSEIDALVASLLASDAASQATPQGKEAGAPQSDTAGAGQQPAAPGPAEFESAVDLGPVTQAELDAATAAARAAKMGGSQGQGGATAAPGVAANGAVPPTAGTAPGEGAVPGTGAAPGVGAASAAGAVPRVGAAPAAGAVPGVGAAAAAMPGGSAATGAGAAPRAGVSPAVRAASPTGPRPAATSQRIPPALRGALLDIELTLSVELGKTRLKLGDILEMGPGSVITLDRMASEPLDVKVNQLPIMKAEVIAIGENYGIRIVESKLETHLAS